MNLNKHIYIIFLMYALLTSTSCKWISEDFQSKDYSNQNIHLKICVLGNSYAADAFSYLPHILREYGISTEIYLYYKGSGSLKDLVEQWNSTAGTEKADGGGNHMRMLFHIDTRSNNAKWENLERMSANDVVSMGNWDIITLQQYSAHTDLIDKYHPYLEQAIDSINKAYNGDYKRAWFMAYNRATHDYPENNLSVQKEIIDSNNFDLVMPVATAVFDARQIDSIAILGDSEYHNLWASDSVHLQEGLPCYIAALALAESILREYLPYRSVIDDKTRPTQSWIRSINGITRNGDSIGVTELNCEYAQRIAILANDRKYEIINVDSISSAK